MDNDYRARSASKWQSAVYYLIIISCMINFAMADTTVATITKDHLAPGSATAPQPPCGTLVTRSSMKETKMHASIFQCTNIDGDDYWGTAHNDACQYCALYRQKDCMHGKGGAEIVWTGAKGSGGFGLEGRSYVCIR